MLDPVARDGAARIVRWTHAERTYTTPVAFAVDAPGLSAPAGRLALSRVPLAGRPTVVTGGSRFTPTGEMEAFLQLADDLPYAPAGGEALIKASHDENLETYVGGQAFIATDPSGALPANAEVVALAHARNIADNPYAFSKAISTLRENAGPERLIYLPGCGMPHEIALLAYAGVDLFDDTTAVLAARQGGYVTTEGVLDASLLTDAPRMCACSGCAQETIDLVAHARHAVEAEIGRVHAAIRTGRLRELVEIRTRATPEMAGHLRRLDKECYHHYETRMPLLRAGKLLATSKESLERPEVARYRRRLARRYRKPTSARILLLLPCSATKPYSLSKTHRILGSAIARVRNGATIHEVVVTSPLGVVPRELENVYPAAQYDLPVTGHWDEDEKTMIRDALTALLARSRYDAMVVHLDESEMEIVAPVLGDFHYTTIRDPLSNESLDNLANILGKLTEQLPRVGWHQRALDDLSSLARFQFGEAGQSLIEGAIVKGRMPYLKLVDEQTNEQLAMTTPDRGYLSLALEGGKRLMDSGHYRVEIDDFVPRGTIFAVGVKHGDAEIAPEDEVILTHNGDFRGVGRALVAGAEMDRMTKGGCVAMRHHAGKKKGGA